MKIKNNTKCIVNGCDRTFEAKGYCSKHYLQYKKYGFIPERTRGSLNKIEIQENYADIMIYNRRSEIIAKARIDVEDVDLVKNYVWSYYGKYIATKANGKYTSLHRLIMNPDVDKVVDHIDHNTLNNQKSNLRMCTNQQNLQNLIKTHSITGHLGVYITKSNTFYVRIKRNYKDIYVGSFKTLEEALQARKIAELKFNTVPAR